MLDIVMYKLLDYKTEKETITLSEPGLTQIILEVPETDVTKHIDVVMDAPGAEAEILGVYVGKGLQKVNLTINAIHRVPNTKCLTQVRAILKDNSHSIFKGLIKIEKHAQQTNSYLDDDVLILGENARNESEPMLEIEANDVKATHGATTGRILEEHLFYLKSRGIPAEDAEKLIIEGFLGSVITKIQDGEVQEKIRNKIESLL